MMGFCPYIKGSLKESECHHDGYCSDCPHNTKDDTISRQAAIDAIRDNADDLFNQITALEDLPSAQPKADCQKCVFCGFSGFKQFQAAQPDIKGVIDESGRIKFIEQPERKKGKWIVHPEVKNVYGGTYIECSQCGEKYVVQHMEDEKYCRNCGAKMEE